MAPQNRKINKYLTCFYCNRKSSTRYDGHMRQFECNNCQASNYLDPKGNITDPPVAKTTTIETAATKYARDPTSSPSPYAKTVFCNKCLQNQHLFISSLAQYLPEDPNDPEYIEREKGYHKFYRGLMKRYPQVCALCEPKVREQLNKAAYTAKTDHLRRMLDRSAETRILTTKSAVNYIHSVGKWVWVASLLLQLLWHTYLIHQSVLSKMDEKNQTSWIMLIARTFGLLSAYLPAPYQIVRWSFWTSFLSFWWNPKWVETWRGFSKHLVGFSNYYRLQALVLLLKLPGFLNMRLLPGTHESRLVVQITANAFMTILMLWVYGAIRKSIRVDHTPLWTPKASTIGAPLAPPPGEPPEIPESREDSKKSMADILDEIMNGTSTSTQAQYQSQLQPQPELFMSKLSTSDHPDHLQSVTERSSYNPATNLMGSNPFRNTPNKRPQTSGLGLGGLSLSDSPKPRTQQSIDYSPNMEWSPTQSKYRAFATYKPGQPETRKFGETPTHERAGAFWAKIPPAPTNPAQRIFNPPNAPLIRRSPRNVKNNTVTFQGSKTPVFSQPPANAPPATIFANPTFRPPPPQDERDSLSEMFTKSFTLEQSPNDNAVGNQHRLGSQTKSSLHTVTAGFKYLVYGGICIAALAAAYHYAVSQVRPSLMSIKGKFP
ncbi:Integral inner nuclear membrane protein ima1 [Cytospora mali]|uniref:Integral inner nuclear membrane protein ima1 n=1 Tax=Cytospora mali TaxID=578113 RepID=A0A194VGY3_CYTMA|nr:Integral inner nuclear membrane protein ima1 [Valsa mali var. pyri (nom. inval.)]